MKYTVIVRWACTCIVLTAAALIVTASPAVAQVTKTSKAKPAAASMSSTPKVTVLTIAEFQDLIKPANTSGKPLVINFWATWCVACREEFPDLLKISADYKDKADFIVISLDDLTELKKTVPRFLVENKIKLAAYLLNSTDEEAMINAISKEWQGGLPFTILYAPNREITYIRQGSLKPDDLRRELEKTAGK